MKDIKKAEKLYMLYEQPLYRIAYAILKNEWQAEDAVSDAFEKIIRNIDKVGNPESQRTKKYVVSIMKSVAIDRYRKNVIENQNTTAYEEELVEDIAVGIEGFDSDQDMFENINERIKSELSEREENLFKLRFVEEKSYKEIADKLGANEISIRKRVQRLRRKIKEVCYGHY